MSIKRDLESLNGNIGQPVTIVRRVVDARLHGSTKQLTKAGLPATTEACLDLVDNLVWQHLKHRGRIFSSEEGGFVLPPG